MNTINRLCACLAIPAATALWAQTAHAETKVQVGTGFNYSTGSYGNAEETAIYEVPFSIRIKSGAWSFRVRAPLAAIDGPGGVVPSEDDGGQRRRGRGSDNSGGDTGDDDLPGLPGGIDEMGLADITLSTTYSLNLSKDVYLDLGGRVTLPTGDEEKDLGTGETDYTATVEIGRDGDFGGIYAQGGYKVRGGDLRENGALALIGAYARAGKSTLIGADVSWSEAASTLSEDASIATGYVSFRMTDSVRFSLYAESGLSDSSPDFGAGIGLTWQTNFRRPFQRN